MIELAGGLILAYLFIEIVFPVICLILTAIAAFSVVGYFKVTTPEKKTPVAPTVKYHNYIDRPNEVDYGDQDEMVDPLHS